MSQPLQDNRRSTRLRSRLPVRLLWQDGTGSHAESTFTLSISRFGCAVHSHLALLPGTPVEIEYEGRRRVGKIVYSLKDHSTNRVELGIGFHEDAAELWNASF